MHYGRKKSAVQKSRIIQPQIMRRIILNIRTSSLLTAVAYIGLLLLFTFTMAFIELVKDDGSFVSVCNQIWGTRVGLFVNVGLLFMLILDYDQHKAKIPRGLAVSSLVMILLVIIIFSLSGNIVAKNSAELASFWVKPWLTLILFTIFAIYLIVVKYQSLTINTDSVVQETY